MPGLWRTRDQLGSTLPAELPRLPKEPCDPNLAPCVNKTPVPATASPCAGAQHQRLPSDRGQLGYLWAVCFEKVRKQNIPGNPTAISCQGSQLQRLQKTRPLRLPALPASARSCPKATTAPAPGCPPRSRAPPAPAALPRSWQPALPPAWRCSK